MLTPLYGQLSPLSIHRRATVAAEFSPASLSPLIWLDSQLGTEKGTSGSYVPASVGDRVTRWLDQSGNGNHFVKPASFFAPLLTADGLSYSQSSNGGLESVASISATTVTVFFVAKSNYPVNSYYMPMGHIFTAIVLRQGGGGDKWQYWFPQFNIAQYTPDAWTLVQTPAVSTTTGKWVLFNSTDYSQPDVGTTKEIVVIPRALTTAETTNMTNYLTAKHF